MNLVNILVEGIPHSKVVDLQECVQIVQRQGRDIILLEGLLKQLLIIYDLTKRSADDPQFKKKHFKSQTLSNFKPLCSSSSSQQSTP